MSGTVTLDLNVAPVIVDLDTNLSVFGDPARPVSINIEPLQIILKGDPKSPLTTDSSVHLEFSNFPKLDFNQLMTLVKRVVTPDRRVTLPVNLNFAFSVFPLTLWGVDAVSFKVCGETMLIREDYIPNKFERGEDCCDPCDEIEPC